MKNFYWFISKRITQGKGFKKGFSRPIVLIATGAIALGIAVMISAISIVKGFQNEVRDKVVGFGAHVQITQNSGAQSKESVPMVTNDSLVNTVKEFPSVRHIQRFAIKPGILETKKDIEGAIIKGVGEDFDWSFFEDKLSAGRTLASDSTSGQNHIMLSKVIADRLQIEVDQKVILYFIITEEEVKPRTFKVVGIYDSGFLEFDEQFVFVPLNVLAKVSQWGIEAQAKVTSVEGTDTWQVEGFGFGGRGVLKYDWNIPTWRGAGPHEWNGNYPDKVRLIVRDRTETIPDTAFITFSESFEPEVHTSGGTHSEYCGGYEVLLTDYEAILNADDALTFTLPYYYRSDTIISRFPEIFNWLATLDMNVIIIIILMIFVAIINMASAILIIILEKTNLIGLFKAFGATTTKLSRVFVAVSFRMLLSGLIIGNAIGVGFCLLQREFGWVKLNAQNYILNEVPIHLNWWDVVGINLGTLLICVLCMLLPVLYVSKIDPVKAIRFD